MWLSHMTKDSIIFLNLNPLRPEGTKGRYTLFPLVKVSGCYLVGVPASPSCNVWIRSFSTVLLHVVLGLPRTCFPSGSKASIPSENESQKTKPGCHQIPRLNNDCGPSYVVRRSAWVTIAIHGWNGSSIGK